MPGKKHSRDGKPEIGIIGAGVSGICAAIQLQKQLGIDSFTLYEQNSDVGGTWLTNTYPGCACDVESHLYSFSFELNPKWSCNFAPQKEIWEYFRGVAKKYNVHAHTKFSTQVKSMTWDDKLWKWVVVSVDISKPDAEDEERTYDLIFNGVGALRIPNFPKEFLSFQGPLIHSAEWNHNISLKDRKVAVIGSGASAIQVIPNIVNEVSELHVYQRKPAYVMPKHQFQFPDIVKKAFETFPLLMWIFRCFFFLSREIVYPAFNPKSFLHKLATKESRRYRRQQIPDNRGLWSALTPKYSFGCKRVLVSEDYYPAMNLPKVKLHTENVGKVIGNTIYTSDGQSEEVDVMILATGYRIQDYFAPVEIFGMNGENVLKSWKKYGPQSYYGIASSIGPNLFVMLGPNTGLGHNSVIFQIECQVNFVMILVKEMMERSARYIRLKPLEEKEFMDNLKETMKLTVWGSSECGSWYADARGEITALWPKSSISYWKETRKVDFSKFEFKSL